MTYKKHSNLIKCLKKIAIKKLFINEFV